MTDLSSQIMSLVKENQFNEALTLFDEEKHTLSQSEIASDSFLVSNMLKTFRKTGQHFAAFEFLIEYLIRIEHVTPDRILTSYGWVLFDELRIHYNLLINQADKSESLPFFGSEPFIPDREEVYKLVKELLQIIIRVKNDYFHTISCLLFGVCVKIEKESSLPDWNFVNNLCNLTGKNYFKDSTKNFHTLVRDGYREIDGASDSENWHIAKAFACYQTENYKECITVSRNALEIFPKQYSQIQKFFKKMEAKSLIKLGRVKEGIRGLKEICGKKKDWDYHFDLAAELVQIGELDEALFHCHKSLEQVEETSDMPEVIIYIAGLLKLKGDFDLSFKHYLLAKFELENLDLPIPDTLINELNLLKVHRDAFPDYTALKTELSVLWEPVKVAKEKKAVIQDEPRMIGKIIRILKNDEKGMDGFLKNEKKETVYFRLRADDELIPVIKDGLIVEFTPDNQTNSKRPGAKKISVAAVQEMPPKPAEIS